MLFPRMTREAYYHVLECQGNNSGGDGRVDTAVMRCDSRRMLRLALGAPALVGDRLTRERPWHSPVVRSPTVHGGIPGRPGRFESSRWGEKRARQEARLRELGLSAHSGRGGMRPLPDHGRVVAVDCPHDVGVPALETTHRQWSEGAKVDHFMARGIDVRKYAREALVPGFEFVELVARDGHEAPPGPHDGLA